MLEFLDEGLSTADIAERLYIAKVTVRSHAAEIVRKLQVPIRGGGYDCFEVTMIRCGLGNSWSRLVPEARSRLTIERAVSSSDQSFHGVVCF